MTTLPHRIREAKYEGDMAFAVRKWVDTMRFEPWSRYIDGGIYRGGQQRLAHQLIGMSDLLVACDPEAEEMVHGVLVGNHYPLADGRTRHLLHWLYVDGPLWGMGICRSLFRAYFGDDYEFVICTQPTRRVADKNLRGGLYDVAQRYRVVFSPFPLLGVDFPTFQRDPRKELARHG